MDCGQEEQEINKMEQMMTSDLPTATSMPHTLIQLTDYTRNVDAYALLYSEINFGRGVIFETM